MLEWKNIGKEEAREEKTSLWTPALAPSHVVLPHQRIHVNFI